MHGIYRFYTHFDISESLSQTQLTFNVLLLQPVYMYMYMYVYSITIEKSKSIKMRELGRFLHYNSCHNAVSTASHPPQSTGDLFISGLTDLRDLSGLENLARYGPELSIVNNQKLTTTVHLSANVTPNPTTFLTLTNVGVRSNPLLQDLDGLSLVSTVTGKIVYLVHCLC